MKNIKFIGIFRKTRAFIEISEHLTELHKPVEPVEITET